MANRASRPTTTTLTTVQMLVTCHQHMPHVVIRQLSVSMVGMDEPRWLTADEDRAWRGYRRMHLLLDLQIARDLMRDSGLSEADYDVLSTLSETDGHRMRLTELAEYMLWSKSRLSHHAARMEQRGLVQREDSPDDARGSLVVLTRQGLRTIQKAAP